MQPSTRTIVSLCATFLLLGAGSPAALAEEDAGFQQQVQDAWIKGKLESTYLFNRQLNPFDIDTEVSNGVVTLSGVVASDIQRNLAEEIAKGIDDVRSVENNLEVDEDIAADVDDRAEEVGERRAFGRWVNDATTTAAVRWNLVTDGNIAARHISIETRDGVVKLSGEVNTEAERDLAVQITENTGDVVEVRDELRVKEE